ncbi:MAG: hypothetical protein V4451_02405 [Pseudomonadota bacterium]
MPTATHPTNDIADKRERMLACDKNPGVESAKASSASMMTIRT